MAKIVTVTGVERQHQGQTIYDALTVSPSLPAEWFGGLYVETDAVKVGDEIKVDQKTDRAKLPPPDRNKQGRAKQIPISYLEIVRVSDGKQINRRYP